MKYTNFIQYICNLYTTDVLYIVYILLQIYIIIIIICIFNKWRNE